MKNGDAPETSASLKNRDEVKNVYPKKMCIRDRAEAGGFSVKEYYREHILRAVTKGTGDYMLTYRELDAMSGEKEHCFQHTCECASLAIGLWQCREVIWDSYTQQERDKIAEYLREFGDARTVPHNWRLFNICLLYTSYLITDQGRTVLEREVRRLKLNYTLGQQILNGGDENGSD